MLSNSFVPKIRRYPLASVSRLINPLLNNQCAEFTTQSNKLKVKEETCEPVLSILSDTRISVSEIHSKVSKLESYYHGHISHNLGKLKYILDNFGVSDKGYKYEQKSVRELEMLLVKAKGNEVMILISHLIFRDALSIEMFMKGVLRVEIADLLKLIDTLKSTPEELLYQWHENRCRVMSWVVVASRFKMLHGFDQCRSIISDKLLTEWVPAVGKDISISDAMNMMGLLNGMVQYDTLKTIVGNTRNADFIFSLWVLHYKDTTLKEELSDLLDKGSIKGFIIDLAQDPVISTNKEMTNRVLRMVKDMHIGSLPDDKINRQRVCQWVEFLVNDLDSINDRERLSDLIRKFEEKHDHEGDEIIAYAHER